MERYYARRSYSDRFGPFATKSCVRRSYFDRFESPVTKSGIRRLYFDRFGLSLVNASANFALALGPRCVIIPSCAIHT